MKLTDYDLRMLNGEFGEAKQIAMQKTIDYAKVLGAEELVDVDKGHCIVGMCDEFCRADPNFDRVYSKMFLGKEVELSEMSDICASQDDICYCDAYQWEFANQTKELFDDNNKMLDRASELGIARASTCTPYLTGWIPLKDEVFVTTESSNVLMCNCIFGARGNGGGQGTAFLAMLTGRTPKSGYHLDENRHGTHVFNIKCRTDRRIDWDAIGYTIGELLPPNTVPVLVGDFKKPDMIKLKSLFATMATTSGAEMCHIVGLSPEARTLEEALGGKEPAGVFDITQELIDSKVKEEICCQTSGPIDFVQLGCPHCNLEELNKLARYMKGKKVHPNVKATICTNIATLQMAEVGDIAKILRDAGCIIMTSGCVNVTYNLTKGATGAAFSSSKLVHYQQTELDIPIYYGTHEQCLDAAIAGYWEVK